jgi:acetyltransferase-like isoleucine patch superfamily enzyme
VTAHGLPEYDLPVPIPDNIEIGPESQIWSRWAFLHYRSRRPCGLRVGRRSALWGMTMLDLGPEAEVSIGDHCTMLDVTFATNGSVTIGDCSMIGHRVVIAGAAAPCPPTPEAPPEPLPAPIVIGSNTWITAGSVILPGARIGDDAVVGTGTVVDGEVPAGATAFGNPFRVVTR